MRFPAGAGEPVAAPYEGSLQAIYKRLDPATDGRPDPRPDVREKAVVLGNRLSDFDFTQPPRPALPLPGHPTTAPH